MRKLSTRNEESLIEELPETLQGRISYYHYSKKRINELKLELQKLEYLNSYLKSELGPLTKGVNSE